MNISEIVNRTYSDRKSCVGGGKCGNFCSCDPKPTLVKVLFENEVQFSYILIDVLMYPGIVLTGRSFEAN
jgi:hypothetical protein